MRSSSTLPVPQPSSAPSTPTHLTEASSDVEEEERGDLIQFYNDVYIEEIQNFALKYSPSNGVSDLCYCYCLCIPPFLTRNAGQLTWYLFLLLFPQVRYWPSANPVSNHG